jgi:hypothetical protein
MIRSGTFMVRVFFDSMPGCHPTSTRRKKPSQGFKGPTKVIDRKGSFEVAHRQASRMFVHLLWRAISIFFCKKDGPGVNNGIPGSHDVVWSRWKVNS